MIHTNRTAIKCGGLTLLPQGGKEAISLVSTEHAENIACTVVYQTTPPPSTRTPLFWKFPAYHRIFMRFIFVTASALP